MNASAAGAVYAFEAVSTPINADAGPVTGASDGTATPGGTVTYG